MVEHALQGEDTGIPIVDFIASDERLTGRPKSEISAMLLSVGFSDEKQQDPVASLSGGWKMKLELARAMLIGADILLLDEPTNHLGKSFLSVQRVELMDRCPDCCLVRAVLVQPARYYLYDRLARFWFPRQRLYRYCMSRLPITRAQLIIQIHYESKKLAYYTGNLSKFVERVPEAKSYYTLSATSIK